VQVSASSTIDVVVSHGEARFGKRALQKQKRGWLRKELPRKFKTHVSTTPSIDDLLATFQGNRLTKDNRRKRKALTQRTPRPEHRGHGEEGVNYFGLRRLIGMTVRLRRRMAFTLAGRILLVAA
jgi:hypothetical protein